MQDQHDAQYAPENLDVPERDPLRGILEDIEDCTRALRESRSTSLPCEVAALYEKEKKVMVADLWKAVARRERGERGAEGSA
jgi:hypothetical protein